MNIQAKGNGNKSQFIDIMSGEKYGNFCPVCKLYIRPPSIKYPYSVWRHTQTIKHDMNNNK